MKGGLIRVLVGNKLDLEHQREVQGDSALTIAENYDIEQHLIFEISALEGSGFDKMLEEVVREIRKQTSSDDPIGYVPVTGSQHPQTKPSKCDKC